MSLSARDQHALHSIEEKLADSDPRLASALAAFTRLAAREQMPTLENVRATWRRAARLPPRRQRHPCMQLRRFRAWRQLVLLLWLVAAIGLIALALTASRSSGKAACAPSPSVSCKGPAPVYTLPLPGPP